MNDPQPDAQREPASSGPARIAIAGSLLAAIVFAAATLAFARWGGPSIDAMAESIAEIHMEQGNRFSDAGDYARAVDAYQKALAAKFAHAENKAKTLQHLGYALRAVGRRGEAAETLREALAEPGCSVSTWQWLTATLAESGQYPAALEAAVSWEREAARAGLSEFAALAQRERRRIEKLSHPAKL